MRVIKIVIFTIISLFFLVGAILFLVGYLKPSPGGISIDSSPSSNVYINGEYVDKTPYKNIYEVNKTKVRLVPDGVNIPPYETDVNLTSGAQSVIKYQFGQTKEESHGYVLTFDKDPNKGTGLIITTEPANAQVLIDDTVRGFSPYKESSLSATKHKVTVKSSGYQDKSVTLTLHSGFVLNASIKLSKLPDPTPTPQATPSTKVYIEITNTPTGFLRVRTQPGSSGEEIAEVKPGSKYLFLEEDTASGWYKIQYSEPKAGLPNGIQGWVSNQYSKKVEE